RERSPVSSREPPQRLLRCWNDCLNVLYFTCSHRGQREDRDEKNPDHCHGSRFPGVYLTHTYGIEIGRHFSINSGALIDGRGGVRIGDWVMIGPHAVITSSEHQSPPFGTPMASADH